MSQLKELSNEEFIEVIDRTPLVSIDLVIRDDRGRILLGRRVNEPAAGKWFVPGGRIHKENNVDAAEKNIDATFESICEKEILEKHSRSEARLINVYTHIYDTNVYKTPGISTHYVVLAHELCLDKPINLTSTPQHSEFKWFSREEADPEMNKNADPDVHPNVLPYFRTPFQMDHTQYEFLNARRDSFNNLVWQTPVVSLTAQAFLFSIILSSGISMEGRIIAGILALITAFVSLQLLAKHRFMEIEHAKMLQAYEEASHIYAANRAIRPGKGIIRWSSYRLWIFVLWVFLIAALFSLPLSWLGVLK
jgi:colanic acid biosynthesis protein WcaH